MTFKVCIAGSRGFNDYALLEHKMDALLRGKHPHVCIVQGEATGADRLGKRYGLARGYQVESYPANWDKYGKRAGYLRNVEMADAFQACVCFWDGVSRGTAHMIEICKRKGVDLRVIKY